MDYLAVAQFYFRKGAFHPFLWRTLIAILILSAILFTPVRGLLKIQESIVLLIAYTLVELYALLVGYILQPNAMKAEDELLYLNASAATPGRVVLGRYTGFFGLILSLWLIQTVLHLLVDFALTRGANIVVLLIEHLRVLPSAAFFMVTTALFTFNLRIPGRLFIALLLYLASYLPVVSAVRPYLPQIFILWYPGAQRFQWIHSPNLPNPTIYYAPYIFTLIVIMIHFFWERSRPYL